MSLYRDVKSNHWASRYIQIAVNEGWFTGYTDGSFHADESIKLEEGATVILRLLGYTAEDLQGAFPSAQLSKCSALGLNADVRATPGTNLNRLDCAKLFSNLLVTPMKSGELYGSKLGYEIKNGSIQYATLINANTQGPFVVQSQGFIPPLKGASIWKNGAQAYGIVISSEKESAQIGDDAKVRYKVMVTCMDGVERIFFAKSVYTSAGRAVSVTYESGETQIENLPVESLSGLFSN